MVDLLILSCNSVVIISYIWSMWFSGICIVVELIFFQVCVAGLEIFAKLFSPPEDRFWEPKITSLKLCWPLCCVYSLTNFGFFLLYTSGALGVLRLHLSRTSCLQSYILAVKISTNLNFIVTSQGGVPIYFIPQLSCFPEMEEAL